MLKDTHISQSLRLAPLGIHYGLVHEIVLKGMIEFVNSFAKPLLLAGDASMQWYMGAMHHTGTGVEKDLVAALAWYEKSAAQGFCMGEDGLRALTALEKDAEMDLCLLNAPWAKVAYEDLKKLRSAPGDTDAVFWEFLRCANLENSEMQILLGMCYEKGIHVPPQWEVGLEWYRRAGAWGNRRGLQLYKSLSRSKFGRRGREGRYELEFVCELAAETILEGPEPGNAVDAFRWYSDAAEKDDLYACWRLAECFSLGYGVCQDHDESYDLQDFVLTSALDQNVSIDYVYYLGDTPRNQIADREATLKLRSQMKAAMARPISLVRPPLAVP